MKIEITALQKVFESIRDQWALIQKNMREFVWTRVKWSSSDEQLQTIIKKFEEIEVWVDGQVVRERWILFVACLSAVYFVFYLLFLMPVVDRLDKRLGEIEEMQATIAQLDDEARSIIEQGKENPNLDIEKKYNIHKAELKAIGSRLDAILATEMLPTKVASLLKERARDTEGLSLARLSADEQRKETGDGGSNVAQLQLSPDSKIEIHRRNIEVQFSANYYATLSFLQSLKGEQGFYWDDLSYRVTTYPEAEIILKLYTLGSGRE